MDRQKGKTAGISVQIPKTKNNTDLVKMKAVSINDQVSNDNQKIYNQVFKFLRKDSTEDVDSIELQKRRWKAKTF